MTDKAYIVANEEQEREVLTKLEQEGYIWFGSGNDKPTEYIPSKYFITGENFPIAITSDSHKRLTLDSRYEYLNDEHYNIIYDGRGEEDVNPKMKISQEVYDALVGWKESMFVNKNFDIFVGRSTIDNFPKVIHDWWTNNYINDKENNNRLIAIIRWVNGEDVFKVEKPKKWVVRSKEHDEGGHYQYVKAGHFDMSFNEYHIEHATRFDTKEEAESWANAHQEVVEVEE